MKSNMILFVFDLFGTFFFALSGGFRAVKYEMDLLGVVVLSTAVGVGGGIIRDTMLGIHPPAALGSNIYLAVCILGGIAVFAFAPKIASQWDMVKLADAIGLGVFAAIGASKAHSAGLGLTGIVLCGTISAVGGGVVRDVLVGEIPSIFSTGFYASTAIIGSFCLWLLNLFQLNFQCIFLVSALLTIILRLLAIRYDFGLPRVRRLPASPAELTAQRKNRRQKKSA